MQQWEELSSGKHRESRWKETESRNAKLENSCDSRQEGKKMQYGCWMAEAAACELIMYYIIKASEEER